jgi:hypothetical protein
MPLQLKDETTGHIALEISGGGALIGIDGASDSVHILAVCGNPIIKSSGVAYDNTVISASAAPGQGSVTLDGSGRASVAHSLGTPPIAASGDGSISTTTVDSTYVQITGGASTSARYTYW